MERLFPRFPDFRYVAYGSLSTVADDGRLQDLLIIQDFSIFFIIDGILNQGQRVFIFAFRIEHGVEAADGLFDLGLFTFTQALFFQVDELDFDVPFFEIADGFLCIKTLIRAKNLDIHGVPPLV